MAEWVAPSRDEIEAAALAVVDGTWPRALPPGIEQIEWVEPNWQPKQEAHRELWRYYSAQRETRSDRKFTIDMVDPVSIRTILPSIMLLDVEDGGFDARYRVYGTGVSSMVGKDWTGYLLSAMNEAVKSNQALFYRACYRAIFLERKPLFTHHLALSWIDAKAWQRLIVPVFDKDGGDVARFLVSNLPVAARPLNSQEWLRLHESRYRQKG